MIKKLMILTVLVSLAACAQPIPCMTENEVGVVQAATTNLRQSTVRGLSRTYYDTTVTLKVGNVHRICYIDDTSLTQLQPGMRVSLVRAIRKY